MSWRRILLAGALAVVVAIGAACEPEECDESDAGETCNEWSASQGATR